MEGRGRTGSEGRTWRSDLEGDSCEEADVPAPAVWDLAVEDKGGLLAPTSLAVREM